MVQGQQDAPLSPMSLLLSLNCNIYFMYMSECGSTKSPANHICKSLINLRLLNKNYSICVHSTQLHVLGMCCVVCIVWCTVFEVHSHRILTGRDYLRGGDWHHPSNIGCSCEHQNKETKYSIANIC